MTKQNSPKILIYDIETAPMLGYVWGLWDNNVALNQIHTDWYVLSWSAKWLDSKEVIYMDQRHAKNIEDDSVILKKLWNLLDEADVVVTQNGKKFDQKKVNARFLKHGFPPPKSYKHIDTKQIASKHFAFTSNKLEYMTDKFCTKYKKIKHTQFPGFEMWKECLKGNILAWKEMEKYNKYDVLSLEELYQKLVIWDTSVNFSVFNEGKFLCSCGNKTVKKCGYHYTSVGKYERFRCKKCLKEIKGRHNLITSTKR